MSAMYTSTPETDVSVWSVQCQGMRDPYFSLCTDPNAEMIA